MTPAEALIELAEARANEVHAADQLRTVLDLLAESLKGELTTSEKLSLGKLALDLHQRFRDRVADCESKERKASMLARHQETPRA